MRLSPGQFVEERHTKDLLVIHHSVGGSARSTFEYWESDPRRVSTAYIIDRDGTIYETFDPSFYAFHIAVPGAGVQLEKRSIGIELASEGGLRTFKGRDGTVGYYSFDRVSDKTRHLSEKFILPQPWRGFTAFDEYEPAQLHSLFELAGNLLTVFPDIPRRFPSLDPQGMPGIVPTWWKGVAGHCNFRQDKTDPHPGFPWGGLSAAIGLKIG